LRFGLGLLRLCRGLLLLSWLLFGRRFWLITLMPTSVESAQFEIKKLYLSLWILLP
jgi:hypothetical protein